MSGVRVHLSEQRTLRLGHDVLLERLVEDGWQRELGLAVTDRAVLGVGAHEGDADDELAELEELEGVVAPLALAVGGGLVADEAVALDDDGVRLVGLWSIRRRRKRKE